MTFVQRIGTAAATCGLMLGTMAGNVMAAEVVVSGNGYDSYNKVVMTQSCTNMVSQTNYTNVATQVNSQAGTGGNSASYNTGAEVSVETGNATSAVSVAVAGSSNEASNHNPCCACQNPAVEVKVTDNGAESTNKVKLYNAVVNATSQKNKVSVVTAVTSKAKTGKNKAVKNTGSNGSVSITTGGSTSGVEVVVAAPANTLN